MAPKKKANNSIISQRRSKRVNNGQQQIPVHVSQIPGTTANTIAALEAVTNKAPSRRARRSTQASNGHHQQSCAPEAVVSSVITGSVLSSPTSQANVTTSQHTPIPISQPAPSIDPIHCI